MVSVSWAVFLKWALWVIFVYLFCLHGVLNLTFSKLTNLSIECVVYDYTFLKKQVIGKTIVKSLFEQI